MGAACCSSKYESGAAASSNQPGKKATENGGFQERFAIPEGSYNVKLSSEKFCSINSATYLPSGDIVMSDNVNNKLKLFNCNFEYISCLEISEQTDCICASPNLPLIYATFPDRVRQIHVDGDKLKRSGFIKTLGHCRGMCVNRFDGKAISMSLNEDEGQVNLLTPGGNLQLEIYEDDEGENLFIQPEALVVTRDLNLVVADTGANAVIGVHPDGEIMFTYRGVRCPSSIVCDELNYIYVAGPNNIHQLNSEGKLVKLFLTKAEIGFSPLCMCYNAEKKHLLVTGKGSKVALFKLTSPSTASNSVIAGK